MKGLVLTIKAMEQRAHPVHIIIAWVYVQVYLLIPPCPVWVLVIALLNTYQTRPEQPRLSLYLPTRTHFCLRPPHYLYQICTSTDQNGLVVNIRLTMTSTKRPPSTSEAANDENNTLISEYFKRASSGRPKKIANMATDKSTMENIKSQGTMSKSSVSVKR